MSDGYTYVWEFQVPADARAEFERRYGAEGDWVQLFRSSPGYLGTRLLKDRGVAGRYLSIDRWRDEDAYLAFRASHAQRYDALDAECASLTSAERLIGAFMEPIA